MKTTSGYLDNHENTRAIFREKYFSSRQTKLDSNVFDTFDLFDNPYETKLNENHDHFHGGDDHSRNDSDNPHDGIICDGKKCKTCKINKDESGSNSKVDSSTDNKNNGLITKIWGGPGWTFNHAVTFGYPIEPTDQHKKDYKNYFISLGNVLPCKFCRESYQKFITTGDSALTDEALSSREALTRWFFRVHNAVNNKLGVDYGITYEDVVARYESFRAKCGKTDPAVKGCVAPLDYKAFSFKKLYQLDCPIISFNKIKPFVILAQLRNIIPKYFCFYQLALEMNGDFNDLKKLSSWEHRNMFCQNKIKYMREAAIPSIEQSGEWEGTPTIDELILILFLCSNLNKTELEECIKKLSIKLNNI